MLEFGPDSQVESKVQRLVLPQVFDGFVPVVEEIGESRLGIDVEVP